jgi:hypothetical protein
VAFSSATFCATASRTAGPSCVASACGGRKTGGASNFMDQHDVCVMRTSLRQAVRVARCACHGEPAVTRARLDAGGAHGGLVRARGLQGRKREGERWAGDANRAAGSERRERGGERGDATQTRHAAVSAAGRRAVVEQHAQGAAVL